MPVLPSFLPLLAFLALVSVLTWLDVLILLWPWDLLLGRDEGAVLVPVDLGDLGLLGLMTKLGDLGCTEGLLDTAAALVVFREAGAAGAVVGMEGPVGAGAMPGLEDLLDGECMAGAKGLELEVMVNMQGLVAKDNNRGAHHKQLREVIVGTEDPGG